MSSAAVPKPRRLTQQAIGHTISVPDADNGRPDGRPGERNTDVMRSPGEQSVGGTPGPGQSL